MYLILNLTRLYLLLILILLYIIKPSLKYAENALSPDGHIYFEINEAMGQQMIQLLESFNYSEIEIVQDMNDKERIIKGMKKCLKKNY